MFECGKKSTLKMASIEAQSRTFDNHNVSAAPNDPCNDGIYAVIFLSIYFTTVLNFRGIKGSEGRSEERERVHGRFVTDARSSHCVELVPFRHTVSSHVSKRIYSVSKRIWGVTKRTIYWTFSNKFDEKYEVGMQDYRSFRVCGPVKNIVQVL